MLLCVPSRSPAASTSAEVMNVEFGRLEGKYPGFYIVREDGLRLTASQVTEDNVGRLRDAVKKIKSGWGEYVQGIDLNFEEISRKQPFQPGDLGLFFMILAVEGEAVGLSNHDYFDEDGERRVTGGLVIANQYRRRGYATLYLHLSSRIAKENGAKAFIGLTRSRTLLRARIAMGWKKTGEVRRFGGHLSRIEKRL